MEQPFIITQINSIDELKKTPINTHVLLRTKKDMCFGFIYGEESTKEFIGVILSGTYFTLCPEQLNPIKCLNGFFTLGWDADHNKSTIENIEIFSITSC